MNSNALQLKYFLWQEYKKITAFITACKYGCLINEYEISNNKKKRKKELNKNLSNFQSCTDVSIWLKVVRIGWGQDKSFIERMNKLDKNKDEHEVTI